MKNTFKDGTLIIFLEGRVDSSNMDEFEHELMEDGTIFENKHIAFDATDLEYISSAGLRVLLKFKKRYKNPLRILNASDEVYDIFDITGFTDIFEVERRMREVSISGCRRISSALNGEIFQYSDDEMIKVFAPTVPLSTIKNEHTYAQSAMAFGIPTLIPYDVVKCEEGYGIIFEKAETTSLSYMLAHNPNMHSLYANMLAKMLKEMHSTPIPEGKLPDIKDRYREWIKEVDDPTDSKISVFSNLIDTIADKDNYINGDINLNSIMVQNGELVLLDMSGSARGHALFDLSALYASLVGMEKKNPGYCKMTYGISSGACKDFWDEFFNIYMQERTQEIKMTNELLLKYFVLKESILTKLENKNSLGKT